MSSAAPEVPDLEAARKKLQERCPAADVWYVTHADGRASWTLAVHADTPEHLVEALRDTAQDAGVAP